MLNFFKKLENKKETAKKQESGPIARSSIETPFDIVDFDIDDEEDSDATDNARSRSKLSKNLLEIISDKNCICYFVQFLETKNALSLIKFYLDTENFKKVSEIISKSSSSPPSLRTTSKLSNNYIVENDTANTINKIKDNDANKSSNNVPESNKLCNLSMHKPLTDDEKSQLLIYSETNKIIKNPSEKYNTNCYKTKSITNQFTINKQLSSIATDAIRIYKKYLTTNSPYSIDIPAIILSNISLTLCAQTIEQNNDDGNAIDNAISLKTVSSNCFEEAKRYVFERMEEEYLNEFLESNFYCKYCLDIFTSTNIKLSDILYNELALFYFMEYLEHHNCQQYLEFWIAATNYRKHYKKFIKNVCEKYSNNYYYYSSENNTCDTPKNITSNNIKSENTQYSEANITQLNNEKHKSNESLQDLSLNSLQSNGAEYMQYEQEISSEDLLKELQTDAMILYEKYFSLQASFTNRLNRFPDSIRSKIEETICSNNPQLICKCFNKPLKIIEKFFEDNYLEDFIKSQLFTKYLNELRSKSNDYYYPQKSKRKLSTSSSLSNDSRISQQKDDEIPNLFGNKNRRHRKTLSDCTIDDVTKSFRRNTLLAMESPKTLKSTNAATTTASDMLIETKYLTNPDLLWYRNSSMTSVSGNSYNSCNNGLTFGRIDTLGRYERDFETIQEDKSHWSLATGGNKIKTAMRKLINLPEEKVQEEIAWQVAELIVKDITSVTLKGNEVYSSCRDYSHNLDIEDDDDNDDDIEEEDRQNQKHQNG